MRIASLHLKAYGAFEEVVLDLERPPAGLQLVYGPNERGKTTALRAIAALLFGFPKSTDDTHGRDYGALRVGAVLDDGVRRVAVMRRKGSQRTLFEFDPIGGEAYADRVIEQSVIDRMTGGMDRDRFLTMHGLGSAALRRGGAALVDADSDLGATLFEAASGVPRLRRVAASLDEDARRLFVPRGQNPALNAALQGYEACLREERAAGVRPRDWGARREALAQRRDAVSQHETVLRERRARLVQVERLLSLIPQVARQQGLALERARLAAVVLLPEDAGERLAAWRAMHAQSQGELAQALARLAAHQAALQALEVSQPHLAARADIVRLTGRLREWEALRRALSDRIAAQAAAGNALHEALHLVDTDSTWPAAACAHTSPAPVFAEVAARARDWLLPREAVAAARERVAARQALDARRQAAAVALEAAVQAVEHARAALAVAGCAADPMPLQAVVDAVSSAGDLEQRMSALRARLETADQALARQAIALGGPDAQSLSRHVPIPLAEVECAEAAQRAQATEHATLRARRAEPQATLPRLLAERDALALRRPVIDRQALEAARRQRDQYLGEAAFATDPATLQPVLDRLSQALQHADRLADARFDDAARLADIESLSLRIEQIRHALGQIDEAAEQASQAARAREQDWAQRLGRAGLSPMPPAAYREWANRHARLLDALQARDELAAQWRATELEVTRLRDLLQAALSAWPEGEAHPAEPPTPSLVATLAQARLLLAQAREASLQRARRLEACERAEQALAQCRRECDALEAARAAEGPAWEAMAAMLQRPSALEPVRLAGHLDVLDRLRDALVAWELAQRAHQDVLQGVGLFLADVQRLAQQLGQPAPHEGHEAAFVEGCSARLAQAEQARDERLRHQTGITQLQAAIEVATERRDAAQRDIAALQHRAGVTDLEALYEAIAASTRRRALDRELDDLETMIRAGTGAAHEVLLEQARTADVAALKAEATGLAEAIAADEAVRESLLAQRTAAQQAFDAIDGDAAAARAATETRERLAAVARMATDWARVRIAHALLEGAVQRHAQRAQGPLLRGAARWFARITAGRWRDLRPDWSGDRQILVAERDDGVRLAVGALSEGTADALYLALRLAAIELRLETATPMPLFLDDVLMTFDDVRAAATLQGLAQLGQRNQVVYFTHHRHLIELAREVLPPSAVAVSELAPPATGE